MGANRRATPTYDGVIRLAPEGTRCDLCHSDAEVANLAGYYELGNPPTDGIAIDFSLCTHCAARLIETVSRFRMVAVLDQMYTARDTARNIRLVEP